MRTMFALAAAGLAAGVAQAQVDGSTTGDGYGFPYAIQSVNTGFGDNQNELNAAFARVSGGRFYLALTGNLQDNFNKLDIFIQTGAGGSNTFTSAGNDNSQNMNGMVFAGGFAPNYHVIGRRGNFFGDRFDVDFANLNTASFSFYGDVFGGTNFGSGATGIGVNGQPIEIGYNGSNTLGVVDGTGPANLLDAALVTTGFEMSIALSDLGLMGIEGETICVMAFINNQDHNYASNQFLPGLTPPQGNLGSDGAGMFTGAIDFDLNGFQEQGYFVVPVPAPASVSLLAMSGLLVARRRR